MDPNVAPVSGQKARARAWAKALAAAKDQLTTATKEAVIAGDVALENRRARSQATERQW